MHWRAVIAFGNENKNEHEYSHTANPVGEASPKKNGVGNNRNIRNNAGYTPLFWATTCGHTNIIKYLAEEGKIDVNIKDYHGWTVLHNATRYGHLDIIKCLIHDCKAYPNNATAETVLNVFSLKNLLAASSPNANEYKINPAPKIAPPEKPPPGDKWPFNTT